MNGDPKAVANPFNTYIQPILPWNEQPQQDRSGWAAFSFPSHWAKLHTPSIPPPQLKKSFTSEDIKATLDGCLLFKKLHLQVHYISSATRSKHFLYFLTQEHPPAGYLLEAVTFLTLHLDYDTATCSLRSFSLLVPHPKQTYVFVWDLTRCPCEDVDICKNHFRAILQTPGYVKIVYGVQGLNSLHNGTGLEIFDRVLCAQQLLKEWCHLTKEVVHLLPKVPSGKIQKALLVPEHLLSKFHADPTKTKTNIQFDVLVEACGLSEFINNTDPLVQENDAEHLYSSILHSYLLSQSYQHMLKALGYLQMRYSQLLTYTDFYSPAPPPTFHLPIESQPLLYFVCRTLQEKGAMSIPDLSNDVMQWGPLQVKQQFSQSGGIKKLIDSFPQLLIHQERTFEDCCLDRPRLVKLLQPIDVPNENQEQSSIDPFLPFRRPIKPSSDSAIDVTLHKLKEFL